MISFLSPCVLPIVPGYLSLITGLSVGEIREQQRHYLKRIALNTGAVRARLHGGVRAARAHHHRGRQRALPQPGDAHPHLRRSRAADGVLPRRVRSCSRPRACTRSSASTRTSTASARWPRRSRARRSGSGGRRASVPCSARCSASRRGGETSRARRVLLVAYSLGLGVSFLAVGLAMGKLTRTLEWFKRHSRAITLVSAAILAVFGIILLTDSLPDAHRAHVRLRSVATGSAGSSTPAEHGRLVGSARDGHDGARRRHLARPDRRPHRRTCARSAATRGDGLVNVFAPHATAGIAIIETGARSDDDLVDALERLLPRDDRYRHAHGSPGHGADHVLPAIVAPTVVRAGAGRRTAARRLAERRVRRPQPRQPAPPRAPELRGRLSDDRDRLARTWSSACRASAPRSSPRCRRSPSPPARSTSARASPTPTARPRCSTPPSPPSAPATTSTRPGIGIPELRARDRRAPAPSGTALEYDPDTEVLVTAGATEAIAAALLALCEPGDEVVTFEPYYDSYAACIAMAGAQRRVVQLRTPDYVVRPRRARGARSRPRTRLLLLNSPHNPTGKVFSRDELELIARLCVEHDLIAVTDEVYEHLVFDGEHVPLATLPGHARPHGHDLVGRQDVLVHRLEDRLGLRAARRCVDAVQDGEAVPHLRERRAVPVRRSPPGSGCPASTFRARSPPTCGEKRDRLCRRARRRRASPCCRRPAPTSSPPTSARSARPTASRSAGRCPSGAAWSRCRASCSTTTRTPATRSCASRSASAST